MKRFFVILMILIAGLLMARTIEIDYEIAEPGIQRIGESEYYILKQCESMNRGETGNPVLPWHIVKALLPSGEIAVSMEVKFEKEAVIDIDGYLYPSQEVRPVSRLDSSEFKISRESYAVGMIHPDKSTGALKTESWHGYNILLSSFCPFEYMPAEKEIRYYQKVKVVITTELGKINRMGKTVSNINKRTAKLIGDYVDNPDLLLLYPQLRYREDEYELLVIGTEAYLPSLTDLEGIYNGYGKRVKYETVEYIAANVSGFDTAEQIRNYIIDEYTEYGIQSVLLAGDVELVPARGFWCEVQSTDIYEDDNIPADLYYSALDGSWNDDSDGYWGEPEEDDLLPELAVGRLPFSDETEAANMINKWLLYIQNPIEADLNKSLLAGEALWPDPLTWGSDYLDLLIGWHDDNGYETNGIYEGDDIQYLFEREVGEWGMTDFFAAIAEGSSFIHHSGHASYEYMIKMHLEDVVEENFEQLNGIDHTCPILFTHGCNCGGFDQDDCIAEAALALPCFLTGFVGNSRYGWFNEGQTEGPSLHIHREFVNALYEEEQNEIGTTLLLSKAATVPWVTAPGQHEEGALRWCFYDCNVLADPVLPVWTTVPGGITVNYPNQIDSNTSEITIYVETMHTNEPAANFNIALIYDDIVIAVAETDSMGIANPQIDTLLTAGTNLLLSVSGYNVQPQMYYVSVNATSDNEDEIPEADNKLMNYPNPFNPSTEISFHLEETTSVNLSIYSIKGQYIVTLLNEHLGQGDHFVEWNGRDAKGNQVNSGVYLAKLATVNSSSEIKMLLLK